jgi:hypothetical protein
MALANDDGVIKTFPSDRADQPLRRSVLPRRTHRSVARMPPGAFELLPDAFDVLNSALLSLKTRRAIFQSVAGGATPGPSA